MSSKKITDLTSYSAAELKAANGIDLLFVTDIEHQETKKITALEFATYSNGIGGSYTGSFTGSFTGSLLGTSSWAQSSSYAISASYAANTDNTTAQNIGTQGTGVFKQKSGNIIELKNISAGTNIQLLDDTTNNCIQITAASTLTQAGGPQYSVQYNNPAGTFNGDSNFIYQPALLTNPASLTINGKVTSLFTASNLSGIGFYGTASWATSSVSSSYSLSSSYATTASYAGTASYVTTQTGILASYSVTDNTPAQGNNTNPLSGPSKLSITLTPKTATSKFLINICVNVYTDGGPGSCYAGFYKDNTALLYKFAFSDNLGNPIASNSATYIDTATDLSSRTYNIKLHVDNAGSNWYLNQQNTYSTMTILEFVT